ncbi:MAG: ABC transporter substrate-binding protein [Bacteroidota bacterium]
MRKAVFLVVLALAVLLGALNLTGAAPVTLTVMYSNDLFTPDEVKAFEKENPDIKIEVIPYDQARYMAMNAAGNPPDIVRVNDDEIPYLASRKIALDITPYLKKAKYSKVSDFLPVMDAYKYKGKYYGMIKDWSYISDGFYNKDVFDKAGLPYPSATEPMTCQEMVDLARKLIKKDGDKTLVYGFSYWDFAHRWLFTMTTRGEKVFSADGKKILFSTPKSKEVAKFWFDAAKELLCDSPINAFPDWNGNMMPQGRLGFLFFGTWYGAMAEGDVAKGKIGAMPGPVWSKKDKRRAVVGLLCGGIISAKTKHPKEAFRAFDYMMGGPPSVARAKGGWGLSIFKSQQGMMDLSTPFNKQRQLCIDAQAKYITPYTFSPYLTMINLTTVTNKYWEQALKGQITFDDFINKCQTDLNKIMADNAKYMGKN